MHIRTDLGGVVPALVTPRDSGGSVAIERIEPIVDFLFSKGVDDLFVCGTTGEGLSLTVQERKDLAEAVIAAAAGRGEVVVHIGSVASREVQELAKHAGKAGAHAISSVPPFYYRLSQEEITDHYRRIAELGALPVFIYDIPRATNVPISVEIAKALAEEGLVCGIKIPNADMYTLTRLSQINDGEFAVFTGETHFLAGLTNGITVGTIGSMSNWIPELFVGIKRNFETGNISRAAELQRLACSILGAYTSGEIVATKALVEHRGLLCGDAWLPILSLNDSEKQTLYKAIDDFELDYDTLFCGQER